MKTRSVRIPDELDAALAAAADAEYISVQARIIQALERDLAARGQYDQDHAARLAAALDTVRSRRPAGYNQAMQALEDAHHDQAADGPAKKAS